MEKTVKILGCLTVLFCLFQATPLLAADNVEAANFVRKNCAKCHGITGISQSSLFPRLAAQPAAYIESQLRDMREHVRTDPHAQAYMWRIAAGMSDPEIAMVARYYSTRKAAAGRPPVSPELAEKGRRLYEKGAIVRDVPACMGCHGQNGEGKDLVPRLAGQHAGYLFRQIKDFKTEVRPMSGPKDPMHENTLSVTDEEAIEIAEYLSAVGPAASTGEHDGSACGCPQ